MLKRVAFHYINANESLIYIQVRISIFLGLNSDSEPVQHVIMSQIGGEFYCNKDSYMNLELIT